MAGAIDAPYADAPNYQHKNAAPKVQLKRRCGANDTAAAGRLMPESRRWTVVTYGPSWRGVRLELSPCFKVPGSPAHLIEARRIFNRSGTLRGFAERKYVEAEHSIFK
jgi:hypothetical protein